MTYPPFGCKGLLPRHSRRLIRTKKKSPPEGGRLSDGDSDAYVTVGCIGGIPRPHLTPGFSFRQIKLWQSVLPSRACQRSPTASSINSACSHGGVRNIRKQPLRWSGTKRRRRDYAAISDIPLDIRREELDHRIEVFGADPNFGSRRTFACTVQGSPPHGRSHRTHGHSGCQSFICLAWASVVDSVWWHRPQVVSRLLCLRETPSDGRPASGGVFNVPDTGWRQPRGDACI